MKLCRTCGQSVAEEIAKCPSCGGDVGEGRRYIDDYRIEEVLHEGHASILCRGRKKGRKKPVMIRLFTPHSHVDKQVAARLRRELKELKKLPSRYFVRHEEIRRSSDGLWYRVSEWVDALSWGDLVGSGRLSDHRVAIKLFSRIASILAYLHESGHFIPHLILNDIMVFEGKEGDLQVKIDYKLSRFFDPKLDQPGPMLKQLLSCHPDIVNQRPLDYRSDIWSLGKIFIEILTANFETQDYLTKVDELPLPHEAKVLFKTMLATDPDLRPRSMKDVANALDRITGQELEEARKRKLEELSTTARAVRRLSRRQKLLATLVALLLIIVTGIFAWFQLDLRKKDSSAVLEEYANQYANSVAFLLVEYWLKDHETTVYINRAEGTAFLVDSEGYLLTNRHVACPWLDDNALYLAIERLEQNQRLPHFGFRMFLWFEGKKAFNLSGGLIDSPNLEDTYFLGTAYRTGGTPRLIIAGVAKPPAQMRQLVASPLRDDFAVLKIERVPPERKALPMDLKMDPQKIPKLSRVITLGFPLGSRTQSAMVNVSVTRGHVRRTFENLIQMDASLYGGSSGGPVIDMRGKVIGIASGVATGLAPGMLPITTPLWNLAMVFPITKAAAFLQDIKAGQVKWNGVLDISVTEKLKKITDRADQGHWADAMAVADKELEFSFAPSLVMAAGMMHFCAGDSEGAGRLFSQSLSMDPENSLARLMLFIIDWLAKEASASTHRAFLLEMEWRSTGEFMGYLARVLDGLVDETSALAAWDTPAERSWLSFTVGLKRAEREEWEKSEVLLREAVLAADPHDWQYYLARAKLDEIQGKRLTALEDNGRLAAYQTEIRAFDQTVLKEKAVKEERRSKLMALKAQLRVRSTRAEDKRQVLERIHEIEPGNADIVGQLAFYSAMEENWADARQYGRLYLERKGRQNARRLAVGLLEAQVLHRIGKREEAQASLEDYRFWSKDSWYRAMGEVLLGKRTEDSLKQKAGKSPEYLLTLHTALGFWAEGFGDNDKAIKHYKEALESFLDTWIEFEFARERIRRLRAS